MRNLCNDDSTTYADATSVRSITTLAQREIFLSEQIRPGSKSIVWSYKIIRGSLDLDLLVDVIEQLTLRIPLLQTRFDFYNNELWQIYDRSIRQEIRTIDVSTHSKPLEEALWRMREAAKQSNFMTSDTLYEFTFYIIDSNTHILYEQFHHGIIDGRSHAKLLAMMSDAYNNSKQGKPIHIPLLHFDALAHADATYITSDEYKKDEKFWKEYVQKLKCHAYTQRNINPSKNSNTFPCTCSLSISERQRLQQAAAAMNISESVLYIGVSALCLQSLLGNDYVTFTLPVRATNLTQELGMTSNVVPLLLHIPGDAMLNEVLIQVAKEIRSVVTHQRFRINEIRRFAKYSSNMSFGPYINVLRYEHGPELVNCDSSYYFGGGGIDTNELQIMFWADGQNGRLDILIDDIVEAHTPEQLELLRNRLMFLLDLVANTSNSDIFTIDILDEQCRDSLSSLQCSSFYANRRTPVAAGFLQWNDSADSLVRLVNSNVWVGTGPSPFATSKILLANRVVSINRMEVVSDSVSKKSPGRLLKIDESVWHITAIDGIVEVSGFLDEFGQHVTVQELAKQCHLSEGDQLPLITSQQSEWLTLACAQAMRSENYLTQQLMSYKPCRLSILQNTSVNSTAWVASADQSLLTVKASANELLVAWLIYIARDTQMSQLQIGWDATESINYSKDNNELITRLFAKTVPFSTCIDLNENFSNVSTKVENDYGELVDHLPCLSDLFVRHAKSVKNLWPLAVSITNKPCVNSKLEDVGDDIYAHHAHGSVMTLQINEHNKSFRWIFDKNQISEKKINRISSRLLVLLSSARKHVQTPVGKLDLLSKTERKLLLNIFNDTDAIFPVKNNIHQLFEEQVTRDGEVIAVECEGETMTYAELNSQANQLAHYLIAQGVKLENRVALCVKRSIKMLVAILGILKSGGSYVPLDPIYSSQRLENILEDSEPLCLLVDSNGRKALGTHKVKTVNLDEALPTHLSLDNPDPTKLGLNSSHLAYVIYTSGSTGTPKGVMVEHRQVINSLHAIDHLYDFTGKDIWCLFHSISFDVSVSEMGGAWYYGGKLIVVPQEIVRSPSELYRLICEQRVTVLHHTPTALKSFQLAESESTQTHNLRWIIFAGEPTEPISLRRWYKTQDRNNLRMINMYGPTETFCTTSWLYDVTLPESTALPIGRPLSNIQIYLLDALGELVPLGTEGELYIGGAGVARGYLNRPELTAERFLLDPFSRDPMARMYRTGDRARYLSDGNLVFCGRADQQVKIRGYRIEPGEIEAHLVEHPLVHEAVVLPWKETSETRLVAYIVADSDSDSLLANNLRTYLTSLLPDYMVPAAYVSLSSLPLTPNGKLDRRALPAPDEDAFARQSYEGPQGEMEENLAAIWSELLGMKRISRHDNFFALGGHSLLIVRMLSQLQQLGLYTSVREVFDTPSLTALAKTLVHKKSISIPPNLITADCTTITPEILPLIDLSQAEINEIVEQVPGCVSNIQDIYGLAPLQHGILFHHMMAERGDPYLLISHIEFKNRTVLECYASALQQVIERHDIFRTVFIWKGLNEPAQVVLRQVPSLLTEIKLNDSDEPAIEQLCSRFNPRHYKLDLKQAPLVHLIATPTKNASWFAIQLMHHIVGDNVTLQRLYTEVQAITDGRSNELKTPKPFRNVVAQVRMSFDQDEHIKFFTAMLADVDTPTLPFGLIDVHHDRTEMNGAHLELPQEFNNNLQKYSRLFHVGLASLCHLAWAQVLARASGNKTVIFGTVLLGRLQSGEGDESAMGMLINTLPIRIDIDDTAVENAIRRTHTRLSALLMHEYATLALAQRCSGVPNNLTLFSAVFNYRQMSQMECVAEMPPGIRFLKSEGKTNYPLSLSLNDSHKSLSLEAQVLSSISAARICGYMQQALASLVDALTYTPHRPVRTLTVIPTEECEMLLKCWNNTAVTFPPACCLHKLFEAQVARDGEKIAVECEGETITYADINCQANKLAHYLIAQGVKPDDRIALCMKRSIKMIIAILGIFKSGAAYVPLDPIYSSQRLTNILKDSEPFCLLVDATGQMALGIHEVKTVDLDGALPTHLSIIDPCSIELGVNPAHLAYIIYTSGSTGTPKGVMVEHRQVINLLHAVDRRCDFTNRDIWCLFHSFAFDISVYEICGAWYYGRKCIIVPQQVSPLSFEFVQLICEQSVTVLIHTPATLKAFQNSAAKATKNSSLRWIFFGGESFEPLSLRRWYETQNEISNLRMCQMYGPTETTIFTTSWIYDVTLPENATLPIGRPLSNIRTYILDAFGEPVPLGAEGELYIGGDCVTRGYLNRPELTAERFLLDPFSADPKARMYRTGDLARYLPDGNLVFCGRTDQQVKIRGYRIEPGEIETHLVQHPLVREAVVQLCNDNTDSDTKLVAYVVADSDASLANNLRNYLASHLPDYMIPAAYVSCSSFPLTPNGKLDRRALPAPGDDAFARQSYEVPMGEMEEKVAAIWSELLGMESISRHDNFFALGGHSLLIVRMLSRLQQLGLYTSVREVFDTPSLAALAKTLVHRKSISVPPNLITKDCTMIIPEMLPLINLSQAEIDVIVKQVPGGVSNIQDMYGLIPWQHGLIFHYMVAEYGDQFWRISQMEFKDRTVLEYYASVLQQLIERNDILRTAFFWEGLSEPAQVVLRQVPSLLTEIKLNDSDGPEIEQLCSRFNPRHYKLDLKHAPLLRLIATPTTNGSWIALLLWHHIISDNVSWQRLFTEMRAIINGNNDQLKTPTPFRNVVARVRLSASETDHKCFFTEMLADVDTPTLPFGLKDVQLHGVEIDGADAKIPHKLEHQLRSYARLFRITLASLCHLAWAQVLSRASGSQKVVFGTILLGRFQSDEKSENVVGMLINTLPIRIDIDDTAVESAVRQAHTRLSDLLIHESATLALAQRCSGVSSGVPLFSSLFNFLQILPNFIPEIAGVSLLDSEGWTNYPVTLSMEDNGIALNLSLQVVSPLSAARICAYMQQALESLIDALDYTPERSVRTLTVIPQEEREMLLKHWNNTDVSFPPACCVHELFEAQVVRNGQAIAVECEGQTMTYAELNSQANQLAHYLIAQGVKPDDRIALCVKRSIKMITAILGVLKSGGAYVPLDPIYSSQRLKNILTDNEPVYLLADNTGNKVLGDHEISMIDLDEALPVCMPNDNPDSIKLKLTPAHLAYVLYTSGTTGTPKGVMVEHRQVTNLLQAMQYIFDFNYKDVWCLFHPVSFDMSVMEIGGAWYNGGKLVIIPQETMRSPPDLYRLICDQGVTLLYQTPVAMKNFQIAESESIQTNSLRWIIFGGDSIEPVNLRRWYKTQNNDNLRMAQIYGSTETTVFTTFWLYDDTIPENTALPIGRPFSNIRTYILDAFGELVSLGAEGELYIGGACVARGYLNQPDLTAERFLSDSFSEDPTARMYRTGDRARYLPDGNLVFCGRTDQQVKICGFRIEPREIETRLTEHPLVYAAAVLPLNDSPDSDTKLVAYVVPSHLVDDDSTLIHSLRTHIASLLPNSMVLVAYVFVSSLPLTPNGKLDRCALPAPDKKAFQRQLYEAPQGEIEEMIAKIWCDLLGIEYISRNDNFFELGGHSLLVMQLTNRVGKLFNRNINTRILFLSPILKEFADRITHPSNTCYSDFAIPVRQTGDKTPIFFLPHGGGDISYAFELANGIDKCFPIYALPWSSPEKSQPTSIQEMASTMITMIKNVHPFGPCAIAGYSAGGILACEIVHQLTKCGYSVSFLGLIDTYPLIDASQLTESLSFLHFLERKYPFFKSLIDTKWWIRVSKLSLSEAIEEVKNMKSDLKISDIELEALSAKQQINFMNLCIAYNINSVPIKANLFKARDVVEDKSLGSWENYNISIVSHLIPGDHGTMMKDPKNRIFMVKKINLLLHSNTK